MRWWERLAMLTEAGQPVTVVTVIGAQGSTPREVGATMLVTEQQTHGSIGGGQLEYQCAATAAKALRETSGPHSFVRRITLGANTGQCCGGIAEILFERVDPANQTWATKLSGSHNLTTLVTRISNDGSVNRQIITDPAQIAPDRLPRGVPKDFLASSSYPRVFRQDGITMVESLNRRPFSIALFGAGHVGSNLVHMLHPTGCSIHWFDTRESVFPSELPVSVAVHQPTDLVAAANEVDPGSYALVMTHSHAEDFAICTELLQRDDLKLIGLIGSRSKRRRFEKRWQSLGLSAQAISRLTCPIGVPSITGKEPARIALATAAQVLELESTGCHQAVATPRLGRT